MRAILFLALAAMSLDAAWPDDGIYGPRIVALVDGQQAEFVVDTGASISHIPRALVNCDVGHCESISITLFDGSTRVVDSMERIGIEALGTLILLPRAVLTDEDIGVLGLDFLRIIGPLQFTKHTIERPVEVARNFRMKDYGSVATISGNLADVDLELCFDSGASVSLVFSGAFRKIGHPLPHGRRLDMRAEVSGATLNVPMFPLEPITLEIGPSRVQIDGLLAPTITLYGPLCDVSLGWPDLKRLTPFVIDFIQSDFVPPSNSEGLMPNRQ